MIDHWVMRQAVYQIIEVSVTYAQFPEPRELIPDLAATRRAVAQSALEVSIASVAGAD